MTTSPTVARYYGCTCENPKESSVDICQLSGQASSCRQGADPPIFTNSVSTLKLKKVPAACQFACAHNHGCFRHGVERFQTNITRSRKIGFQKISHIDTIDYPYINMINPISIPKNWNEDFPHGIITINQLWPCRPRRPCRSCGISTNCRPRV